MINFTLPANTFGLYASALYAKGFAFADRVQFNYGFTYRGCKYDVMVLQEEGHSIKWETLAYDVKGGTEVGRGYAENLDKLARFVASEIEAYVPYTEAE